MDVKVTWKIEVVSAVDGKSKSVDVKGQITKVTWSIKNFSSIKDKKLYSENFVADGKTWRIIIFPKGNKVDYLSIYLDAADSANLPVGWSRHAQFGFAVIDQIDRKTSHTQVCTGREFKEKESGWGFTSFLSCSEFHNPKRGYLVKDTCLLEAYISTNRTQSLISDELNKEVYCGKTIKHEVPNESVAIGQEDMKMFFSGLESEFSSFNIVYSQEEAKEAMAKLDEALNITPINLYDLGMFSPLKQTFKILASLDCSSTRLTIEEKNELLAMEERLKKLADRGVKAVQDKNLFAAKEYNKLSITRNIECSLIRYKEVDSEVTQIEQKLVSLLEEVEEARKKKENMFAIRKEIFKSSKDLKLKLEALREEWEEYEANAKVAEEEEKTVEAEWGRMKDFFSSIKGKI